MGSAEWIPDQVRDDDDGESSFWSSAAKVGHRHGARFWPFGKVHMARSVREKGARLSERPSFVTALLWDAVDQAL